MAMSKKYIESWEPANKWLNEHAPDFVIECITELISFYEKNIIDRDECIVRICEKLRVDPKELYKSYNI